MFWLWKRQARKQGFPIPQFSARGNRGGIELPSRLQVDPIEGYRTWRVKLDGTLALHSLMQKYVWEETNTAECIGSFNTELHADYAPAQGCVCGFYVQKPTHPLEEWENHVRGRVRANGQAALSGRIIVCEYGYKAQHARIVSPVFLDVDCNHKGCLRDVTRIQVGPSLDFWGFCADHDPGRADAVLVDSREWMGECVRQLSERYPNTEFLTFHPI